MAGNIDQEHASGRGLARILGVDERAVRKARDRGLLRPVTHGQHQGKYNVAAAKAAWAAGRDPDAVLKGAAGAAAIARQAPTADEPRQPALPESSLGRARAANVALDAQKKHLELGRLQGKLISRDDARRAARAVVTVVCERLEGAAAQIGARVVGVSSAAEAEKIAREILRGVRAEVAGIADAVEAVGNAG